MNRNLKSIISCALAMMIAFITAFSMTGCDLQSESNTSAHGIEVITPTEATGAPTEATDAPTESSSGATQAPSESAEPTEPIHIHNYTEIVTNPTCTEGGFTTFTCDCGDTYEADHTEDVGHGYETVVISATCTKAGYTVYTCHCGHSYTGDEVDAAGHNYTENVTAQSCVAPGYTTYTCAACGDTYQANQTDATGHSYSKKVTAPTCTTQGYATYTCTTCGYTYTADQTAATGHSWGSWKVTTEAQIGIPGVEEHKCSSCQKVETRAIDALPEPTYQAFEHEIGVYEYDNVRYEMALANHFDYAAYIAIYTTSKESVHETSIIAAFADHFGFTPTAEVTVETIGTYLVDGQVKTVYQYSIFDKTHPFMEHAPYEVYHQICTDGVSHWVGFAILGSNDDDWDTLMSTPTVQNLKKEMYQMFYEKTGYSAEYIAQHKDDFCMGWISVAGEMRTADGEVVEVLYIYCREKTK